MNFFQGLYFFEWVKYFLDKHLRFLPPPQAGLGGGHSDFEYSKLGWRKDCNYKHLLMLNKFYTAFLYNLSGKHIFKFFLPTVFNINPFFI
jgi:hypothetical protein